MTLRQVWRFLRDCQFVNHDSTLATFDRVFNHGKKNHFTLLGTSEVAKFNLMYGLHGDDGPMSWKALLENDAKEDDFTEEPEIESKDEGDDNTDFASSLGIEPENVHGATRVVLQRQFFEVVVRAAYVRFANNVELPTLADKLDFFIRTKLVPNAGKTKAKSVEDEVSIIESFYFFLLFFIVKK